MANVRGIKTGKDFREVGGRLPQELQMRIWAESVVNKGMITSFDPDDIPPGALQECKNAVVRFDRTARRPGHTLFGPTKPDTEPVLKFASIKEEDGAGHTVRFTPSSLYELTATPAWVAITGAGLNGTVNDRIKTAVLMDKFAFVNNGADEIQEIDFAGGTYAPLGNAPKYRYLTGFYERFIGAAERDVNEVEIGWSGQYGSLAGGPDEWDPLVDETAGYSPIVESTSDLSDYIKGLFGFTNVMIVMRERSVWLATKQPSAQAPLYFSAAVPGIGCDSPNSIAVVGGAGLAWLDRRTQTVYSYFPGNQPEPIGRPVESRILRSVDDPEAIFGSYDPINNEYSVCIPQVGSKTVLVWTFNFRGQTWAYNEIYDLTSFDDMDIAFAVTTIDQLVGTIDALTGTIDDLSPSNPSISTRILGRGDGSLMTVDPQVDVDPFHDDSVTTGLLTYETDLWSKSFRIPQDNAYIVKLVFELYTVSAGTVEIEFSRDGGISWTAAKTVTLTKLYTKERIVYMKPVRCGNYSWRLRGTSGLWDLLDYEIHVYESGRKPETRPA